MLTIARFWGGGKLCHFSPLADVSSLISTWCWAVLALREQCGKKAAEVVAVARPRPRGVPKNPH
jgi:hypothetical protein